MNLTQSLLQALKANGARQIFGIPGDFALPYFRIIEETGSLPLYALSHEPGVGFAADAAARIGGALGTSAANLAMKSSGSKTTCVVPSRYGVLSRYTTLPFAFTVSRFSATAGRANKSVHI